MTTVRGLFITGTDTGVGKTLVSCALASWCRKQGVDVGVMKPVATGGKWVREERRWISQDARLLVQAAGVHEPWSLTNPVCFPQPLAPLTAAQLSHRPIQPETILNAFQRLRVRHQRLIVEGVGGLFVPLGPKWMVAHLARQLRLDIVIVARAGLGTLNHTLLSLNYARQLRLPVRAVILNATELPQMDKWAMAAYRTNPRLLRALATVTVLGPLSYRKGEGLENLSTWLESGIGKAKLKRLVG